MPSPITIYIENMGGVAMKNKLKVYRAMKDLTQEQLADKLQVSRQTVIAIESNRYLPSLGLAFKIAKTFQVKIEDVFIYDNKEEHHEG
jgi:putative transcriptional regulator